MRDAILSLNKGLVSRLGLGRIDLKRLALAATLMTNWVCRVLGYMHVRNGLKYIIGTFQFKTARYIPFVFATDDTALIELTDSVMRPIIDDALIDEPTVATTITNGLFLANLNNWTDLDEVGATSSWDGTMKLVGTGTNRAIREQQVTVSSSDQGVEHFLSITINRGPVYVRVGSASGDDDYVGEAAIETGSYVFAFTPTGDFFVRFFSPLVRSVRVSSVAVVHSGGMTVNTPWTEGSLDDIRFDQSGDVVYVACDGEAPRMIQRRGQRPGAKSWGVAMYAPLDGPFMTQNVTPITLTPSAINGDITIAASQPIFAPGHLGALFSITSEGQTVTSTITAENTFTNAIRITGVGTDRVFAIEITGTFVATVTLQRSLTSDSGPWTDLGVGAPGPWTAPTAESYDDNLDNQIAFYRLGVKTGDFTSGTAVVQLSIGTGSIRGIIRVIGVSDGQTISAQVLQDLGGTDPSAVWQEGEWSEFRGYPTCCKLHDGRLWWAGRARLWGSISDAFDSFDETFEGDAGPINRSIGTGPVDNIAWMLSMQRMLLGAQGAEFAVKASSLDEPLTPSSNAVRPATTQGSASIAALNADQSGYFVNRSKMKLFELAPSGQLSDYSAADLTAIVPEIGYPGISRIAIQRQPDTRFHCVLTDGTVAVLVLDRVEEVLAWSKVETAGFVEDVVVLPAEDGDLDDRVYYAVRRTIDGLTVRYLERWAQEIECRGAAVSCLADSYVQYTGSSTTTITGLDHLEGEEVVVWANGLDIGTADDGSLIYTVDSGQIVLPTAQTNVTVGLPYTARWRSAKLGSAAEVAKLFSEKKIGHVGLLLADLHPQGLRFGQDFDNMDSLPPENNGSAVGAATIESWDKEPIEFPSAWGTDVRLCLEAKAPRPCTVMAITIDMTVS